MNKLSLLLIALILAACTATGKTLQPTSESPEASKANPASENCVAQGGTLTIEERGDLGQFGVCYFEDNMQCEEWALMRGDCPVGGVKVTGYVTEAGRYCAITGGEYAISGNSGAEDEQGTCTFKDGSQCDAWAYYNGECSPGAEAAEWQTYTDTVAGFSIQVPPTWSQQTLPDQADGAIHGMAFTGAEGGVEVYWGAAFGGACPTGTEPVQLAQGEVTACHETKSDGTEGWSQIGYVVTGGNYFSANAYTSNSQQSSHDLVLQVLSTLAFMPASEWQSFTNREAGFSVQVPPNWGQQTLPDQNDGNIHGEGFTGPEGGVEVYWGVGFGGACPEGTEPVQLAQGEVPACHTTKSDGTEVWEQIGYVVDGGNAFSSRAYTVNAEPSSHDLLLQVLATLSFMPPAEMTIQPLSMEVCDGQAQAMSHTLNDLVPTQSEEPLEDWENNAYGTGCQAAITGTGMDFESPTAVVGELGSMLEEQGWTADPDLVADGPTGTAKGYRKEDQICWAGAMWTPDASANCPKDQAISACEVTPEQQLYTVTLNCGVEVPVGQATTSPGGSPEYGGGAGQIVFDSTRGGDYRDLYVMNSDGYDMSRLTRGEANSFAGPWSPDGQRIVYTTFGLTNSTIAVINADGSEQSTLAAVDGSDEGFPDWAPDGLQIAFTSRRDGNNEIYVMNADGSSPIRLTNHPGDDFAPSWSPDGTQIVFVSDRDQTAGVYDLYIMNADGSGVTRLTNDPYLDYSPDWSPDGNQIVFRSHHDGPADIYVINVDGSGLTNLTNDPAEDWAPTWSPDGKYIAFQTNRDGNFEIYRMAADGSDPVNLTNDSGDDQLPYWRP